MNSSAAQIREQLNEAGLKSTPQRQFILDFMMKNNVHPTVDEVYQEVRRMLPDISKATVYQVLESCASKGILHRMSTADGVLRYDFVHTRHHHLVDVETGEISDYHDQDLLELVQQYLSKKHPEGFEIVDINVELKVKKEKKS